MSSQNPIFVVESNDFVVAQIHNFLIVQALEKYVEIVGKAPDTADSAVIKPQKPIRLGQILDQILGVIATREQGDDFLMIAGGAFVDTHLGTYYAHEKAEPVRLTEKEVALLVLLEKAQGQSVSRETLLEKVWQYADSVETHTLETHIYRLRQKIEIDPAEPKILQTGEAGYFLSLENV